MDLATVIAAIIAVGNNIPEFVKLIEMVKAGFDAEGQAEIDAALQSANDAADAQHAKAQGL
jgi:hypothetical protein